MQESWSAAVVNVPVPHAVQMRSLEAVGAVVYSPAEQTARTAVQAAFETTALKVVPATQSAHWRSAVAVPPLVWPWPTGHVVDHAVQEDWPAVAVNVPLAHAAHVRSLEAVAGVWNSPATQAAETATHSVPSSTALKVVPTLQSSQVRSVVVVPTLVRPLPTAQVDQSAHVRSDVVVGSAVLYVSPVHATVRAVHVTLLVAVAAVLMYSRPVQLPTLVHSAALASMLKSVPLWQSAQVLSTVVLPPVRTFCPTAHSVHAAQATVPALAVNDSVQGAQVRSEMSVIAADRPWPGAQKPDPTWHALPSSTLLYVAPKLQSAQVRSTVALPATDSPWPMAQVCQAAQVTL